MNETTPPSSSGPQADRIQSMFNEIAGRYDLANTVLSGGIHHLWRRAIVKWSGVRSGQSVLDCATGTGDLAIAFKKVVGTDGEVVGTDFSSEMLVPAPAKARKAGVSIAFSQADVTNLPFPERSFDVSSISFGIRNVQDPVKGLRELARVVRPGGKVMILEFGQPTLPGFQQIYDFYSKRILPRIGGLITGRPQAYQYLQDSSAHFPCREGFVDMMQSTGVFSDCEYRPLTLGIAYMYKGIVKR